MVRIDPVEVLSEWHRGLRSDEQYFLSLMLSGGEAQWLGSPAVRKRAELARMAGYCDRVLSSFDTAAKTSELGLVVVAFHEAIKGPVRKATLLRQHGWIAESVPESGVGVLPLLLGMRSRWCAQGTWVYRDALAAARDDTLKTLGLQADEIMAPTTAARLLAGIPLEISNEDRTAWFEFCGIWDSNNEVVSLSGEKRESDALQSDVSGFLEEEESPERFPDGARGASSEPRNDAVGGLGIREWARAQGYEVAHRGRVSSAVREAYSSAVRASKASLERPSGNAEAKDLHSHGILDKAQGYSVPEILRELSLRARDVYPQETLGSLLMDSDRLEEPFRSLAERLLFATACASDASGWVIPGAGLPSSSPARALPSKERAFQALEKVGHPLSSGRLLDEIGGGVGIVSLKSQLSADNRFVRSDVDAWALSDWGMRPYTSIKALVSEELDKAGGELAASRIVEVLTTEFSIKEGTLRQTIAVAPFTSRGGVVRRRADVYEEDLAGRHAASMGREASREHGDSHAVELTRELGLDW